MVVSPDGRNLYAASPGVSEDLDADIPGAPAAITTFRREPSGAVVQLPGRRGCVARRRLARCGVLRELPASAPETSIVVSPDGGHVYVAAGDVVLAFRRAEGGALAALRRPEGCLAARARIGCRAVRGASQLSSAALSPDGTTLYVGGERGLAVLSRDPPSGALTQLRGRAGCVTGVASRDRCRRARGLESADSVAVGAGGGTVYVASLPSSSIAAFARDRSSGELRQLPGRAGCVRSGGGPGCMRARALRDVSFVIASRDGRSLYAANIDAIAVFSRVQGTGEIRQLRATGGCVSEDGNGCAGLRGFDAPSAIALSHDGGLAYVGGHDVAVLARDRSSGSLKQLPGKAGCVNSDNPDECVEGDAATGAFALALSGDDRHLYTTVSEAGSGLAVYATGR